MDQQLLDSSSLFWVRHPLEKWEATITKHHRAISRLEALLKPLLEAFLKAFAFAFRSIQFPLAVGIGTCILAGHHCGLFDTRGSCSGVHSYITVSGIEVDQRISTVTVCIFTCDVMLPVTKCRVLISAGSFALDVSAPQFAHLQLANSAI